MFDNLFHLYDDDPEAVEAAHEEIYAAVDSGAKLPNKEQAWLDIIYPVLSKHSDIGASDTYSRDLVWYYFLDVSSEVDNESHEN